MYDIMNAHALTMIIIMALVLMAAGLFNEMQKRGRNRRNVAALYPTAEETRLAELATFPTDFVRIYCEGAKLQDRDQVQAIVRGYDSLATSESDEKIVDRYSFPPMSFSGAGTLEIVYDDEEKLLEVRGEGPQVLLRPIPTAPITPVNAK